MLRNILAAALASAIMFSPLAAVTAAPP